MDTIASLFADDTASWMKDGKIRGSNKLMQEEIDKILAWATRWKMKGNEGITKAMVIASSRKDTAWDREFNARGKRIDCGGVQISRCDY